MRGATPVLVAVDRDSGDPTAATGDGRPAGAFGDLAAFSFCQDKIITTGGEGGLLTLDDEHMWRAAWTFKDHGKSYQAIYEREHPPGFRYVYESFGTNWRMLEVQAAIGRLQLPKLPGWHARRHAIATRTDAQGVPCYAGSAAEIYLEKAFRDAGLAPTERFPIAQELGETSLCFLCHPTLSDEAVGRTIEVVDEVVGRATR